MTERRPAAPLQTYQDLFVHRTDLYAQQTRKGAYFLKEAPVTRAVVRAHLEGRITAGWYALAPDHTVRWVALDAGQDDGLERLQNAWSILSATGILSHLELSRRGGHLWVLFEPSTPARLAHRLVLGVLTEIEGVEVYPKRDQIDPHTRVGNLMRGPLGTQRLGGKRYPFVDPVSLRPVSGTILGTLGYLETARPVSTQHAMDLLGSVVEEARELPTLPPPPPLRGDCRRLTPMEELKERLGDPYEFIRRFVDLDEQGRRSCPFHPPDRHSSFAVDRRRGFWGWFHDVNPKTGRYVGGDVIAFYKRLIGLSYQEVLRELREVG